ncbi:hypothetical protein G5C51_16500 [Streptomyces sp. A7024]|uniref:Endonuclease/exonuclease/phosphatase family protein n=1 Tax=Streptomyces coryli TaxID=1128680 RepID=A0A6G4U2N3_9ACTN|nr:hypothetical protein [Streptomyces coryli]NGN65491.1 hypothetical protein [Streptomyces coryli]
MRRRGLLLAAAAAALGAGIASVPAPAAQAATGAPNNDPAFLQAYVNNVENLPTVGLQCPGDWQDLVHYMKLQTYRPDVFVMQQISNQTQLNSYTARLSQEFGETYRAVIAEPSPAAMNSPCGAPKDHQTNAVIYRTGRFDLKSDPNAETKRWQAQSDESGSCANNDQARTKAVKVRLHDKAANKDVTVASVHWPTAASGGPACAESNAAEAAAELTQDGYGGSLLIFGGDANITDLDGAAYRGWYAKTNGDLGGSRGYRDGVYAACAGDKACLAKNWTLSGTSRRIDFLFARKGAGGLPATSDAHTVTWDEGDAADKQLTGDDRADMNYSDHRAVRVRVHY